MKERALQSTAGPQLDPTLDFLRLLWSIEHGLQSTSKRMGAAIGITGPQRLVLKMVSQSPDMSAGELARIVRLHPSTITGILQRLVAKGLLTREADPADTRRARLRVVEHAKSLTRRSPGTVESAVQQVLRRVPPIQVAHARTVLTAIADALDGVDGSAEKRARKRRRGDR